MPMLPETHMLKLIARKTGTCLHQNKLIAHMHTPMTHVGRCRPIHLYKDTQAHTSLEDTHTQELAQM